MKALTVLFPAVSVVVPAYNAADCIEVTLRSLLMQTYHSFEVVVVDDGSTDSTATVVQAIAQEDDRIRLITQANAGVAAARNAGIQAAVGQFVAPIDADDIWYPTAIARMVQRFQEMPDTTGVVYAWAVDIDERGQPIGGFHAARIEGQVLKTLLCHNFLGTASATLMRRSLLMEVGGYDTQFQAEQAQGCEDWDLYLRLAERTKFAVVPEFLVGYRKRSGSMSGNLTRMARSQQRMLQQLRSRCPDLPEWLYRLSYSSFYLYLAYQSHLVQSPREVMYWLKEAIWIDPVTPLGRFGFYSLGIQSLLRLGLRRSPQTSSPTVQAPNDSQIVISCPISCPVSPLVHNPTPRLKLWIKIGVSHLLHQSLLRI